MIEEIKFAKIKTDTERLKGSVYSSLESMLRILSVHSSYGKERLFDVCSLAFALAEKTLKNEIECAKLETEFVSLKEELGSDLQDIMRSLHANKSFTSEDLFDCCMAAKAIAKKTLDKIEIH